MTPSFSIALLQSQPDGFALGDFWSLTQQAGPLRWPIFFILAFGLIQVFLKLFELVRDRGVSRQLSGADFASMSLPQILKLVSGQKASMLASLQSTMLNVFQTRPGEGLLHDEITNFVDFQQDQFAVFQRRMEFLSDTAGALGLMGTVWGMFTVFFQGSAEQDVILRGMGIALITTLLGLVVSIILNFSATELSTYFSKRLEQVSRKSDELRFRLMELAPTPSGAPAAAAPARAADEAAPRGGAIPASTPDPVAQPAPTETKSSGTPTRGPAPAPSATESAPAEPAAPATPWRYVELAEHNGAYPAGQTLKDLALIVRGPDGAPAPEVPVVISVAGSDGGSLSGGRQSARATSDRLGRVAVPCTLPERVGSFELDVAISEQPGPPTRLRLAVAAGTPATIEPRGNHQAAIAGMRLPLPLGVQVLDRFGNPVPDVPVSFRVTAGTGKLGAGAGAAEQSAVTDAAGSASVLFVVGSEAGQNQITATVKGVKAPVQFTAFGTEV